MNLEVGQMGKCPKTVDQDLSRTDFEAGFQDFSAVWAGTTAPKLRYRIFPVTSSRIRFYWEDPLSRRQRFLKKIIYPVFWIWDNLYKLVTLEK